MLYIHIPFCKSRCLYCDFFSTTHGEAVRQQFSSALCEEIRARRTELPSPLLQTIYFGGGTPSLLSADELRRIMKCVRQLFVIAPDAEITIEANPNDVTPAFVSLLLSLGFNRLSLGVQTFNDELLRLIGRRHSAAEARRAVQMLARGGIENISLDLIYGLPQQTPTQFGRDLTEAFSLPIKHLSSYALMVEEGTPLFRMVSSGQLRPADEEECLQEYELLMNAAGRAGFEHYEISNFALPGYHSRHNSAYWTGAAYLGCGPGAHSYDGRSRRSNRANLSAYLLTPSCPPHETEVLSLDEKFNEKIFTSLRTANGLPLSETQRQFGSAWLAEMLHAAAPHIKAGRLTNDGVRLRLTRKGLFVSDDVMSDLMRA